MAVVLPLSGKHSEIGQNMLAAIELAVQDFDLHTDVRLQPIDSSSSKQTIENEMALNNPHVIIGPLFSSDFAKIENFANESGVCVMSFSNHKNANTDLPCRMLLGNMPDEAPTILALFAAAQGYEINLIMPDGSYGKMIANTLHKQNFDIRAEQFYTQQQMQSRWFLFDIFRIINQNAKARPQAVVVADTQILDDVAEMVKFSENVRILVGAQNPEKSPDKFQSLHNPWIATLPLDRRRKFDAHFEDVYGIKPFKISAMAYDSMACVLTIFAEAGKDPASLTKDAFTGHQGFEGISGAFRFLKDGTNQRLLSIFEFNKETGLKEIAPASKSF